MNVSLVDALLVLSLLGNVALSIWLNWRIGRHRACRSTLERVAGQRDEARRDLNRCEAHRRGVGGLPGPEPTITRIRG